MENAPGSSSVEGSDSTQSNESAESNVQNTEVQVDPFRASKHKVKLDGADAEVDYDELLKGYQMSKSSQKRFHEAAQIKAQSEELIKLAKTDPRKLLAHPAIGHDLRKFAEEILAEQIEEQLMSPDDKERRDLKRKLEAFENEKKQQEESIKKQEEERMREHFQNDYSTKIVDALNTSGLPRTEHTVKKMAYYMLQAHDMGYDASPSDVVELVRKDYLTDIQSLFGSANEDLLLQLLGDNITNKVVKSHLNKVKKPTNSTPQTKVENKVAPKKQESKQHLSRDEWKAMLDERTGKK